MLLTNMDVKTGIRYGVIPHMEIGQSWYDDAELIYSKPFCPYCGGSLSKSPSEYTKSKCPHCKHPFEIHDDEDSQSLEGFQYKNENFEAHQIEEDPDIFVTKSPFYTLCKFCSPCAPGAGYLLNKGDVKAYCFGHEWFDGGEAPYKIYDVKTDKEIK